MFLQQCFLARCKSLQNNHSNFVETRHKFMVAKLVLCKLGTFVAFFTLMKFRAYGLKSVMWCFHLTWSVCLCYQVQTLETGCTMAENKHSSPTEGSKLPLMPLPLSEIWSLE